MLGTLSSANPSSMTRRPVHSQIISTGMVHYGMQTFDQSFWACTSRASSPTRKRSCRPANPDDFALKVKGIQSTSDISWKRTKRREAPGSGDHRRERTKGAGFRDEQ